MKVSIVTCFESNEERASFVLEACKQRGYIAKAITTDFSHVRKAKRESVREGFTAVKTDGYEKNLSVARMKSHAKFAKDAFELVERQQPDLIWCIAPANSLIKEAKKYKEKYPSVKIIVDIIDMWPESLPMNINKNIFPFNIWRNVRKDNIGCADLVVTECEFYQNTLINEYKGQMETIYWAKDGKTYHEKLNVPDDKISLVYLGSINNIIDVELIKKAISNIDREVVLHIIGDGENKENFISSLSQVCTIEDHGVVRDEEEKAKIFARCHAGINIYKEGLYIGLTSKCIDYFEHGLPIINNIKGDTWLFVKKNRLGINVDENTRIRHRDIERMRINNDSIYDIYNNNFTKRVFIKNCLSAIDKVINY